MKKSIKKSRTHIKGTSKRPRLAVFRSNKYIYAQIIDDDTHKTLVGVSQKSEGFSKENKTEPKIDKAKQIGLLLAKLALSKKIKQVVFDKRRYRYLGRVKAVAQGARDGGLDF